MQVESIKIPLISSSFTYTPKVDTTFTLEIAPARATEELIRILQPIIKFADLTLQEKKVILNLNRADKNHCNINCNLMASIVDHNLSTTVGTGPSTSSYLNSTPPVSGSNYASSLPESNRKRQKLSTNQGESNSRDGNTSIDTTLDANNASTSDNKSEEYNEIDGIERTEADILEKKTSSENERYVAPEQALVTSVELVVPAPPPPDRELELEAKCNAGGLYNRSNSSSCDSTRLLLLPNDRIDGCVNDSSSSLNIRIPTKLALTSTETATTGDILLSDRRTSLWTPHQDQSGHTSDDTNKPDLVNHVSPELPYQQHHRHSELLLQIEKDNTESGTFPVPLQQHLQHNTPTQELQYGRPADANSIIDGQLRNNFYAQMLQQQHLEQHNHQQQSMHEHGPRHQQQLSTSYTNYNGPLFHNAPLFGTPQSDHHLRQQQQHPMEFHGLLDQSTSLTHQQHQHQQQHIQQHHHQQLQHQNQHQQQLQQQQHQQQLQQQHQHQQQHQEQHQQSNQHQQQQHQHQHQQQQQQQQQHHHQLQQQNQLQHQQQHQIQQHQRQQEQLQEQHPQRQLHETYHDLIMEDFHEEPSSAYKLTLSPNNVKPENQDDGYETSAGDVLTPNSHSSSTNSMTPQHQMQQHLSIGITSHIPNQKKSDEQLLLLSKNPINNEPGAASTTSTALAHSHLDLSMSTGTSSRCPNPTAVVDPFSFMGEEMRSMLSSPAAHHRHMESITLGAPTSYAARPESESGPLPVPSGDDLFQHPPHHGKNNLENSNSKPTPKKRGRKKKIVNTTECTNEASITAPLTNQDMSSSIPAVCEDSSADLLHTLKPKERKKHDRFNGMSEDEVIKRTIPDHLCDNLDIVIVGINPGLFAAYKGHHYAGPGNHFWKCLYLAGLTQEQMSADEDHQLLKQGIGFTNMVARATKGSADLTRKEIKEGSRILLEKLQRFRPKIAVFNGKLIFEVFSGKKEFHFGRQPDRVDGTDTYIWVMPSSSARCAQLPRAADKVPFYAALKKFRDFLSGLIPQIDESECVFTDQRIRQCSEQQQQNLDNKGNQSSQSHQQLSFVDNCGSSSSIAGDCGNPDGPDNIPSNKIMPSHMISNVQSDNNNPYTNDTAGSPMRNPSDSSSYLTVFGHQSLPQQPLEKKKRGRPKKIKGQQELIIDHRGQQYNHHHHHDFNNILNLSVVETPKKKRGRPKKLKPTANLDNILVNKQLTNPSNSQPTVVHSLEQNSTTTTDASPPQGNNHQQLPPSLYNTPPPSHILYTASASPMASPAAGLNCNYTQVHSHGTPTAIAAQEASPNDHLSLPKHGSSLDQQPHLGETPPPSSPNMCGAIDFEQPENQSESKVRSTQNKATELAQQVVEKGKYNDSPSHDAEAVQAPAHPNEHHYHQQWLSSPHHHNSLESPQSKQLPPPPIHHYQQQEQAEQWQRSYEEQSRQPNPQNPQPNPYLLISSAHQSSQHLSPRNTNQSLGNFGSDVARKSLCGLESLVDQIPAIREHDESMSAAAQAAAAAVESRLLGLQQQQQQQQQHQNTQKQRCNQDQESSSTSDNNNVINNNNFSVSSLVAAKTDNDNIYLNNSGEHRGIVSESQANNNTNIEYYHHQHHVVPPHLIGTTINSSEPNLQHPHPHPLPPHSHPHSSPHTHSSPHSHPSPHPHPSPHSHPMYMELTNHLSHIPALNVNSSIYASTAYGSHLQHGTGTGSGSGSGSGEYTTGAGHNGHFSPVQVQSSPVPASTTPTLHVPSPNYPFHHHPYGSHTAPQASYSSYVHPSHHGHHHPPPPHHHHLSVFDHLKPSDIGGYGGF